MLGYPEPHCLAAMLLSGESVSRFALERATRMVMQRQEALRTSLTSATEAGSQVSGPADPQLTMLDQDGTPPGRLFEQWCGFEFDPLRPMFEVALAPLASGETIVLLRADQLICDLWSVNVLIIELSQAYGAVLGRCAPSPPLLAGYGQVVRRELAWLDGEAGMRARTRALSMLGGACPPPVTAAHPARREPPARFAWQMSQAELTALTAASRANRTTSAAATITALGTAAGTRLPYPGTPVFVVLTGRDRPEFDDLVMWRSTMAPVHVAGQSGQSFAGLTVQVQRQLHAALENQAVPWQVTMQDAGCVVAAAPWAGVSLQYVPKALAAFGDRPGARALSAAGPVRTWLSTPCPTGAAMDVRVCEEQDGLSAQCTYYGEPAGDDAAAACMRELRRLLIAFAGG